MHTCLWKEPPCVFERVVFAEFDWKYHIFLKMKMEEWDRKNLLSNYWNDLALGSKETYFLEVGACLPMRGATTGIWEGRFMWVWQEISHFFTDKNGGVVPKNFSV